MRVAFASKRGTAVDEHFGRAGAFAIYDVTPAGSEFIEFRRVSDSDLDIAVVETRGMGALHEEAVADKVEKLSDCKIVYFTEIGGPSAAKLVRRGMMPLKADECTPVDTLLASLSETMRSRPAPWMRKALAADESSGSADASSSHPECSCGSSSCC